MGNTTMAAFRLLRDTNMTLVTSRENTPYDGKKSNHQAHARKS